MENRFCRPDQGWGLQGQSDDVPAGGRVSMGQPQGVDHGVDSDHCLFAKHNSWRDWAGGAGLWGYQPTFGVVMDSVGATNGARPNKSEAVAVVQQDNGRPFGRLALPGALPGFVPLTLQITPAPAIYRPKHQGARA